MKQKRWKTTALLLAFGILLSLTMPVKAADPVEIEFWHAMSGENGEVLEELVEAFNESHPEIRVTPIFQGHYRDLFEKLSAAAQAESLPALSMIYGNRLTAYIMNEMVEPLDEYVKKFDKEIWEDIPEGLRDKGIWDGVRYSLPFNKSAYMMFYNVDAFEEKEIEIPKTWKELRAAAEKLTDEKAGVKGISFNKSVGVDFSYWVEQAGGHIYEDKTDTILIDTEETKKAYEFIVGMIQDGLAEIAFEDGYITGPMSRGEAMIGFSSSSALPNMKEACAETGVNWAVAELPKGEKEAALFSGTDITMFNQIGQEEKDAAFEFMKYWFETDVQVKWGMKSGYMPLTNAAFEAEEFKEFLKEDDSKEIASHMYPFAYQDPNALNGYAIHSNMQEALEEILAGDKTIEEALKDAQDDARKEMDEAKKNVTIG